MDTEDQMFHKVDFEPLLRRYEHGFLCPNTTEMRIQGSYESNEFSYIRLQVLGCDLPDGECAEAVDNIPVNIITLKSHVDFAEKDYNDEPISYSFDTTNYMVIDARVSQNMNLFYTKSRVIFDDYPMKVWPAPPETPIFEFTSRYKYNTVPDASLPIAEQAYMSVFIRADNSSRNHRR